MDQTAQMMKQMVLLLAAASLLLTTPALAGNLPVEGVYGDEFGCARQVPSDAPDREGGIHITSTELIGYEWGCSFAEVWPFSTSLYGVQGLCGGEGIPSLEQYIIQLPTEFDSDLVIYAADGEERWRLQACVR